MALNVTYAYLVIVTSADGRTSSQTVLVTPLYAGCAELFISTTVTRFNEALRLVIRGSLLASTSLTAQWDVFTPLGEPVQFKALTSKVKAFNAGDTSTKVSFPLSIEGGVLTGGRSYVFRLSAYPNSNKNHRAFVEITVTGNSPPSAGYLTTTPNYGEALSTVFLIASPGWTADAASFPLSYSFSYSLTESSSNMTLAASSLRAFTTTTLPAGMTALGRNVTVRGRAIDVFDSYGSASTTVHVALSQDTDIANVLKSELATAFLIGNINLAFQTINHVRTHRLLLQYQICVCCTIC